MPRIARIVIEGLPHHITQRGNNREQVFFFDADRELYLSLLKKHSERHGLEIRGYCLMTNHVHLIGVPDLPDSLALAIGRTNFQYAQHINRSQNRSGHVWQNRFFSCPMDDWHCQRALRYAEQNPVRARMVGLPWEYPWSSAAAHTGKEDSSGLLHVETWRESIADVDWKMILTENLSEEMAKALRLHTQTGRPWMDDRVLEELEARLGRRLRPLPPSRPRKTNREPDVE